MTSNVFPLEPHQEPIQHEITVADGERPRIIVEAERALIRAGSPIYQRGALVRPLRLADAGSDWIHRYAGALTLVPVDPVWLQNEMTRVAKFWKFDARLKRERPIDAPKEVAQGLLALAGEWRFPPLRGVIEAPTLRADGSLLAKPGYDPETGLLADFAEDWPKLPDDPTLNEAHGALRKLLAPVAMVPFATDADRALWPAMVCTALIRATLPAAPLIGVSSPIAGSGKTEIVNTAAIIATGRAAPAMNWGDAEEESEKRLGSMMIAGDPLLLIDNIERPLRGEMLCSALTSPEVSVRILGQSRQVRLPTTVLMLATGNNLVLSGDLNRRALVMVIDPGVERPELRRFDWLPTDYAREHRAKLVNAALTLLRAYHLAGYPGYETLTPFGSFEEWSRRVRGALVWAGADDPVAVIERTRAKDPERELLAALLHAWFEAFGLDAITVSEVLHRTDSRQYPNPELERLREIIETVRGKQDAARAVGRYIGKFEKRIVNGLRFVRRGEVRRAIEWAVEKV